MSEHKECFSVAELWNIFAETVMPKTASAIQVKDMRVAFYAGAELGVTMALNDINEFKNQEDANKFAEAISEEASGFRDSVEKGDL